MASYVVMTAPGRAGPDGPEAAFVRDGFHFLALVIPALWLLWRRLWIEALVAFAVAFTIGAAGNLAGYGVAGSLLTFLVGIYVGLEGAALRIAALTRRGWLQWGTIEADSADDAETRFLLEFDPDAPQPAETEPAPVQTPRPHYRPSSEGPGLLLNSGDR